MSKRCSEYLAGNAKVVKDKQQRTAQHYRGETSIIVKTSDDNSVSDSN